MLPSSFACCLALHRHKALTDLQRRALLSLPAVRQPEDIFACPSHVLAPLGIGPADLASIAALSRSAQLLDEAAGLRELGVDLVSLCCDAYPPMLRETSDPPALLYLRGRKELLDVPQLAIVGSRRPSAQGAENARQFAAALCASGLTVTSGLALGIDACAHGGALEVGGNTLAVLGTGIDRVYPAANRGLFEQIVDRGLLLSEYLPGAPPLRGHFPRRNRLISGLSLGVLVVEAALQSGSLVTARMAMEQNREVFAIPGSIHNPNSRGCHHLIRQGAKLVESLQDVLDELGGWSPLPAQGSGPRHAVNVLSEEQQQVLQWLGHDPVGLDGLVARSGWAPAALLATLCELELLGELAQDPGGYQRLIR